MDIIKEFKKTIFDNKLDGSIDCMDIALNKMVEDEVLQMIPIVKKCYQITKTAFSIREMFFCKKMLIFASNLQNGKLSVQQLNRHRDKLEKNPKQMYKELEYILVVIDALLDYDKVQYYANLYAALINCNEAFDWYDFKFMVDILNRLSVYDLNAFRNLYNKKGYKNNDIYDNLAMKRLSSMGLVKYLDGQFVDQENVAVLNGLGKRFYEICIIYNT